MKPGKLVWPAVLAPSLVAAAAVVVSGPTLDSQTDARLARAWQAARKAGFPLTAKDVLPQEISAEEDATDIVLGFDQARKKDERLGHVARDMTMTMDPEVAVSDYGLLRPHALRLSDGSRRTWIVGYGDPDDPLASVARNEETSAANAAARILCGSAYEEARAGRWDVAIEFLTSARRMADLIGQGPTLIRELSAVAIDDIAVESCGRLFEAPGAPPDLGDRLAEGPLRNDLKVDAYACLRGEAYMGVAWYRNWLRYGAVPVYDLGSPESLHQELPTLRSPLQREGWPPSQSERNGLALHLETWTPVLTAIGPPGVGVDGLDRATFALREPLKTRLDRTFRQVADGVRRAYARRRCMRALCLAVAFKARTGRFPMNLTEIGVTDRDPFGDGSLGYRSDGRSIRVWSIGQDRKDQGGLRRAEIPKGGDYRAIDVVATYPRPFKRR